MSTQAKTVHPMARAILAITALGVIVVSANLLISSLGAGHKNADFTEDKVHTLSEGTRGILKELGAPVTIRYYATRSSDYMPEDLKLHMRRVDDLLAEYQNLSGGKLRVEELDPQPDTDAEDAANLDGIRGQRFEDQNLYFGLAVSCIDRTATIPFIDPTQETMLEYEISKAISEVSRADKPVIGLMSGLPIAGNQNPMMMMQGQQGTPPWVFYSQLAQSYEVKDLTMTPEKIDPAIDVLLVFHPAAITPEAEFAIDQYLLQGGTVVACIDPYSVAAQMSGGGNPMMGGGPPTASTLPTLLGAWGVGMNTQVVGDQNYQTTMNGSRPGLAVLTVPKEGMPQKDNVITRDLNSLVFFLAGGLSKTGGAGVAINSLVKSSDKAGLVDAMKASQLDPNLARTIKEAKPYDLVMHLKGNFKSAFPKGKPGEEAKPEEKKDESKEGEKKKEEEKKDEKPAALTEATKEGNVFLISDIDVFFDQFAYRVQRFGGMQMAQPINGNSSLLFNIVDQAASSTHLIGARSRAAIARPFTKIKDLESEFTRKSGEKIDEKQKELDKVSEEINTLVQQRAQGDRVFMDSDLEAKIREGRAKQVSARKELREMEKDLKREKDKISGKATLYNVAFMPLTVILIGLGLFVKRRTATRAR
ncbi:Gldg family protein [Luteolibacter arcticus]|uniref:Gldg family protein n=1 Tax=Luteolibacter arcticus TaxID=1581411 RepID=A0ABT3GKS4_9BACT|nr:Gldg family protein [Luteolibacter arcticus]MCW1924107.1 Gldg family protein [Luteolibacter arcticus]